MPTVLWRFLSRSLYQFFVIFFIVFCMLLIKFYVSSARDIKYIKSLLVLVYYCKSPSAALDRDERLGV